MKKMNLLRVAIAATCLGTLGGVANASDFEVGLGLPYYSFDKETGVDDKGGINLNAGYRFDKPFGVELSYSQISTKLTDVLNSPDVDLRHLHLDGLWYLHNEGNILPYAALGVGMLEGEIENVSDDEEAVNFGLGVKVHLAKRLRARIDGRWLHGLDSYDNHSVVTLGLGYVFGATEVAQKVVAPSTSDADKDGVQDAADQCPNTPAGVSVDAKGCPLDTDKDGVADYLDKCADTDSKLKVDTDGCPVELTEDVFIDLSVKFATGSDVVDAKYFNEILGVARFMEQYANSQVVIEGHTDSVGSAESNKQLSQKRANAVAKILAEQYNIDSNRVSAKGYGEEKLLVVEKTKEDQAANRRVVAKVSAKAKKLDAK